MWQIGGSIWAIYLTFNKNKVKLATYKPKGSWLKCTVRHLILPYVENPNHYQRGKSSCIFFFFHFLLFDLCLELFVIWWALAATIFTAALSGPGKEHQCRIRSRQTSLYSMFRHVVLNERLFKEQWRTLRQPASRFLLPSSIIYRDETAVIYASKRAIVLESLKHIELQLAE